MGIQIFFFVPRSWQDEKIIFLSKNILLKARRLHYLNWFQKIFLEFSLPNKNVSVWVRHTFQIIFLIISAWVMRWPTSACVTIEVIIISTAGKIHSSTLQHYWFRHYTGTLIRNLFNQFTSDWSRLLLHYATRTFLTCDPVVDVALDQEFLTNAAPQRKVHGFIMGLAEWNCCGYSNVSVACCPGWARSDSVRCLLEIRIICKSVTPN